MPSVILDGRIGLEVVGESQYQDVFWKVCGSAQGSRVRSDIIGVLVPEPDNPYDRNAISVQIQGQTVGYLSHSDAAE